MKSSDKEDEQMKISRYTFFPRLETEEGYDHYVYNALSNALMWVDEESWKVLKDVYGSGGTVDGAAIDAGLYDALVKRNVITDSDEDDFLMYKAIIIRQRAGREFMHLTLAPTMDCCFRCHYCFEKYKKEGAMTVDVMDAIIRHIDGHKDLKRIHLTWFGGEPLMAVGQIEEFYDRFMPVWKDRPLKSNIITTGYHIDKQTVEMMKRRGISSVQITLDGMRETHNCIKNLSSGEDVFGRVLDNIGLLNDMAPDINVVIRVNLTRKNAAEYSPLMHLLYERFKGRNNIAPAPAFVMDRGAVGGQYVDHSVVFNHSQRSEFILDLAHKGFDSTFIRYPERFFGECAIRNDTAIAFDPEGYAYKCWEVIGNKEYAIGKLDGEGRLTDVNVKVLNRQLYGADPLDDPTCRKCKYLPICGGGCPIQRIENEFEEGRNVCCSHYKGHIEEFIKRHIRMRKKGMDNR